MEADSLEDPKTSPMKGYTDSRPSPLWLKRVNTLSVFMAAHLDSTHSKPLTTCKGCNTRSPVPRVSDRKGIGQKVFFILVA